MAPRKQLKLDLSLIPPAHREQMPDLEGTDLAAYYMAFIAGLTAAESQGTAVLERLDRLQMQINAIGSIVSGIHARMQAGASPPAVPHVPPASPPARPQAPPGPAPRRLTEDELNAPLEQAEPPAPIALPPDVQRGTPEEATGPGAAEVDKVCLADHDLAEVLAYVEHLTPQGGPQREKALQYALRQVRGWVRNEKHPPWSQLPSRDWQGIIRSNLERLSIVVGAGNPDMQAIESDRDRRASGGTI